MNLVDQPTATPTRKVTAGVLAGAIVILIVWIARDFFGFQVSTEVAQAATTILSFAASYFVRERAV